MSQTQSAITVSRQMINFSTIPWHDQVTFQRDDDVCFVLDQHTFYSASSLKQQSVDRHVTSLRTYYPHCKPPSPCSYSLMLLGGADTNINFIVWFDLNRAETHDIPHSRRAC